MPLPSAHRSYITIMTFFFIQAILCVSRQDTGGTWNSHGSISNKGRASIRKGHWDAWIFLSCFLSFFFFTPVTSLIHFEFALMTKDDLTAMTRSQWAPKWLSSTTRVVKKKEKKKKLWPAMKNPAMEPEGVARSLQDVWKMGHTWGKTLCLSLNACGGRHKHTHTQTRAWGVFKRSDSLCWWGQGASVAWFNLIWPGCIPTWGRAVGRELGCAVQTKWTHVSVANHTEGDWVTPPRPADRWGLGQNKHMHGGGTGSRVRRCRAPNPHEYLKKVPLASAELLWNSHCHCYVKGGHHWAWVSAAGTQAKVQHAFIFSLFISIVHIHS